MGNGLGSTGNEELHRITTGLGQLWIVTRTIQSDADTVWRSSDGVNFAQSNASGSNGQTMPPGGVAEFNGTKYWSDQNDQTVADVWQHWRPRRGSAPVPGSP